LEDDVSRRSSNPNVCLACEQLLEDDSPTIMADIARMPRQPIETLLDEPVKPARKNAKPTKKHQPR